MFWCRPTQVLTGLCNALGACLEPQPLPDHAMLCLLLSAVTAGHSAQDMMQVPGERSQVRRLWQRKRFRVLVGKRPLRKASFVKAWHISCIRGSPQASPTPSACTCLCWFKQSLQNYPSHTALQVHVLMTSVGLEPSFARAMASVAAVLSPHSLCLTSSMPLLPKASEVKQQNAQTGWRLEESALGNAASGEPSPTNSNNPPDTEEVGQLKEPVRILRKAEKAIS